MAAVLWARSGARETDDDGDRLAGAKAYFFDAGTTAPRTVYTDGGLAVPHPHPVVADAYGRWPAVYLAAGAYRYRLTTGGDVSISIDFDNVLPSEEISTDPDVVPQEDRLSTGDMFFQLLQGTRTGAVRANGRTMGSAASGGTERANADCEDLYLFLWNGLTDTICPVATGRGLTAAADWAANKAIGLPDMRLRGAFGLDDMGNAAASRITAALVTTGTKITAGSSGGEDRHTLSIAELAAHFHGTNAAIDVADISGSGGNVMLYDPVSGALNSKTVGSDTPHNNMPPFMLGTWLIKL